MAQREYCEEFKCFEFSVSKKRCNKHSAQAPEMSEQSEGGQSSQTENGSSSEQAKQAEISSGLAKKLECSNPALLALVGRWRCEAGFTGILRCHQWDTDIMEVHLDGEEPDQLSLTIDARIGGRFTATLLHLLDAEFLMSFGGSAQTKGQRFCRITVEDGKLSFLCDERETGENCVEFEAQSPTTSRTLWVKEKEPDLHTRIELHSLNTARFNSQQGVIVSRGETHYHIRLDSGHELKVKFQNVRPVAALSLSLNALAVADVRAVAQCLRSHSSLSASFHRGVEGPPDYSAVAGAITTLLNSSPSPSSLPSSLPPSSSASFSSFPETSSSLPSSSVLPSSPSSLDARIVLMDALTELLTTVYHTDAEASMFCFHNLKEDSPWEHLEDLQPATAGPSCSCSLLALAAAVPLLENSLPTDKEGVCFVPHQHPMKVQHAGPGTEYYWNTLTSKYSYRTQRICDRCMTAIDDPDFYHCGGGCDVDFCNTCQLQIERNLHQFLQHEGKTPEESHQSLERAMRRMLWSVQTMDHLARQVLMQSVEQRRALAQQLASEWPDELFQRLVKVVTDVCDGRIMFNCNFGALSTAVREGVNGQYIQDVLPLYTEPRFWYSIGLLQFLVACNQLARPGVSQSEIRPKIPEAQFTLHGMNKCHDAAEWKNWQGAPFTLAPFAVLRVPRFQVDPRFASLVIHHNLLPIAFRRQCLLHSVFAGRFIIDKMKLVVSREPEELVEDVVKALAGRQPDGSRSNVFVGLAVSFKGEIAEGPGVLRDFLQVSLRAFLTKLFIPTDNRSFWFNTDIDLPDYFFACGALLALALIHQNFIPRVFPETLFFLLLHNIGSPFAAQFSLAHLADVSPAEARSLQQVLDYAGEDIGEVFGELGWERTGNTELLTQATKRQLVQDYLEWSLTSKIVAQFGPFAEGFQAVLNAPSMLRGMITSTHLQNILCSMECEVNVPALRASSLAQDWGPNDEEYLTMFWQLVESFPQATKEQFLVFVTASSQVPLGGWGDLHLVVKKNGVGDERLPAAYTCFNLILLPRYSSSAILQARLLKAINESSGFGLK